MNAIGADLCRWRVAEIGFEPTQMEVDRQWCDIDWKRDVMWRFWLPAPLQWNPVREMWVGMGIDGFNGMYACLVETQDFWSGNVDVRALCLIEGGGSKFGFGEKIPSSIYGRNHHYRRTCGELLLKASLRSCVIFICFSHLLYGLW